MWRRRGDLFVSVLRRLSAAALTVGLATPVAAGPIGHITSGADAPLPEGYVVLDIRDEDRCFERAPANSRCLPAEVLLRGDAGDPIGFHALRWVLGALGLTGAETLVIYPGDAGARDDALAAAGLLYLAGQAEVLVHAGPALELGDGASVRGLWREVIYTAPMRTGEMVAVQDPAGGLRDRLRDYAMGGGEAVAFAAGN